MAPLSQNRQLQMEALARKAALLHSSIGFANSAAGDYRPVSAYELEHKPSKLSQTLEQPHKPSESLASQFVAQQYVAARVDEAQSKAASARVSIVLGSDAAEHTLASSAVGEWAECEPEAAVDLLETIEAKRDSTLDGAHTASMTETHILPMWDSFQSEHPVRAASYRKYTMLRDAKLRHSRSAYNPDERYRLPPTEQSVIGWGISDKYGMACSKFCPGAVYNGRKGSHVTKFQERMLLGARHHLSGPSATKTLHY